MIERDFERGALGRVDDPSGAKNWHDALELLQKIEAGKHTYTDDAPFGIPKFDGARLLSLDPSIRHITLFPEKLLKNDGDGVSRPDGIAAQKRSRRQSFPGSPR